MSRRCKSSFYCFHAQSSILQHRIRRRSLNASRASILTRTFPNKTRKAFLEMSFCCVDRGLGIYGISSRREKIAKQMTLGFGEYASKDEGEEGTLASPFKNWVSGRIRQPCMGKNVEKFTIRKCARGSAQISPIDLDGEIPSKVSNTRACHYHLRRLFRNNKNKAFFFFGLFVSSARRMNSCKQNQHEHETV